jgi:hypothetical protein
MYLNDMTPYLHGAIQRYTAPDASSARIFDLHEIPREWAGFYLLRKSDKAWREQ